MKYTKWYLAFLLISFFATIGRAQNSPLIPKGFVATTPPRVWSDEWFLLNSSRNEFGVSIVDGVIHVETVEEVNTSELKITGGRLVGINHGEFGGQLLFRSDDNGAKDAVIKRGNVSFVFTFKGKIYFIEGLAHMGYSGGALFELSRSGKSFTYKKLINFDDAPQAFTIYDDNFLIATYERFYIVKDFKKELVIKDAFWGGLYPNSIAVVNNNNVFVGIRGGIVKVNLSTKKFEFYKYTGPGSHRTY